MRIEQVTRPAADDGGAFWGISRGAGWCKSVELIKDGTLGEHNTLCRWIVEAPPLVTIRIAKEDALLKVRTKRATFIHLDMNIGK